MTALGYPGREYDLLLSNMLAYLMQHNAHHRGQICMLARALGHEFSGDDTRRLWGWKAISPRPPRRGVPPGTASQARAHS